MTSPYLWDDPPARRPGAPFAPVAGGEAWRVWEAPLAADWAGTPVTRVREGRWTAWLLGELYATPRPDEAVTATPETSAEPSAALVVKGPSMATERIEPLAPPSSRRVTAWAPGCASC